MRRVAGACGAAVALIAVAVPGSFAANAAKTASGASARPTGTCTPIAFAAKIVRVGAGSITVRSAGSARVRVVKVAAKTVVRRGKAVVHRSALAAGARARFLVNDCRAQKLRSFTARTIMLPAAARAATAPPKQDASGAPPDTPDAPTTPPEPTQPPASPGATTTPPQVVPGPPAPGPPPPEVCSQEESDSTIVEVGASSITILSTSAGGTDELAVAVDGDTVIVENDQSASMADLTAGELVHVVLDRCPSGSVTALRIVILPPAPSV